jgi:hypothetical protein
MKYIYMDHFGPELNDKETVFVFGSNLLGVHGAGAAKEAKKHWGAQWKKGSGIQGQSYAIPTKHSWKDVVPMTKPEIKVHVNRFIEFANKFPMIRFLVTPIGTGYAGYKHSDIAPMFKGAPINCVFVSEWKEFLDT